MVREGMSAGPVAGARPDGAGGRGNTSARVSVIIRDAFRTPFLHPASTHNELILKEEGLLLVEQPSQNFGGSTGCSAIGI